MKHCPFCGSKNVDPTGWTGLEADGETHISGPACDDCGASAPSVVEWNTRFAAPAPVLAPLTLDDVTRHTDALCAEYRQRMLDHQAWYTERVGQLSAAIEASADLNHMEAGYIFLTKIRELTAPPENVTPKPVPVAEWIDWNGGDRPIPGETLITVKFRDGTEADGYARDVNWEHTAHPLDVMAYRVNA